MKALLGILFCDLSVIKHVSELQAHPSILCFVVLKLGFYQLHLIATWLIVRQCQQGMEQVTAGAEKEEGACFFLSASSSPEGHLSNTSLPQKQQRFLSVSQLNSFSSFPILAGPASLHPLRCWNPTKVLCWELLPFVPQP